MSPPEVWGPPVWRLIHTLAEKINEHVYDRVAPQLFYYIVRICKFLPCPECSADASRFLAKIKMSDIKTKVDFVNLFYIFHNHVNAKKRKKLFNYANMENYKNNRIIDVYNNFILHYQTKGNMKLLNESFQRDLIIKDFKNWLIKYIRVFMSMPVQQVVTIKAAIAPEQTEVELSQEVPTNVIEEVPTNVIEEVPTNVIEEVPTNVTEEVPTNVTEEVPTNVTEEVSTNVTAEMVTDVTAEMVTDVTAEVVTDVLQEVPTFTQTTNIDTKNGNNDNILINNVSDVKNPPKRKNKKNKK
jgi:hypothetical protein